MLTFSSLFIVLPHCGIRFQTLLPDTTSSHNILTPERPVLALPENPSAKRGATSSIVNDFGMSRPGIEPGTSRSRSGQSTYELPRPVKKRKENTYNISKQNNEIVSGSVNIQNDLIYFFSAFK